LTDLLIIRILFVAVLSCAAFFLRPFDLDGWRAAAIGTAAGLAIVVFEIRVKRVSLKRLIGAAFGSVLGILGAYLISLVLGHAMPNSDTTVPFVEVVLLVWMTYCGLVVGASKGEMLNLAALGGLFGGEKVTKN
jgi:uncharacterized protein YacL